MYFLSGDSGAGVGAISAIAGADIPIDFVECDGSALSRILFKKLFNVIGESYGVGDGLTTFNIPDLRGEFIRGFDNGRGIDAGRLIATAQADEFKSHSHTAPGGSSPYTGGSGGGLFFYSYSHTTDATGGNETRPRNIAMMYIIKY